MALPGMLELTKEQTQRLVNIIEDKQGCICNVSNSMRTCLLYTSPSPRDA